MLRNAEALARELEKHRRLFNITKLLNSSLDMAYLKKKTIEAITEVVDAEAGSLLLYDDRANDLYFEIALGEKGAKVKAIRLKIGEGIAGTAAKEKRSLIVSDVQKDPRFMRLADARSGFITRNILCSPLLYHGRLLGVIQAINKKGNEQFSDEDLVVFESFADIVSIALENANLYLLLKETFLDTSFALAEAVEKRDPYTGGHIRRVTDYCLAVADELGVDNKEKEKLHLAAILHDIGKIGIDDNILRKTGPLTLEEATIMKRHPSIGVEILNKVRHLVDIVQATFSHHESFDGNGYPQNISGKQIPLYGRIIAVCDTFDAMTSDRPYRRGLDDDIAIKEIEKNAGIQFDPDIVSAFINAFKKGEIASQHKREGAP